MSTPDNVILCKLIVSLILGGFNMDIAVLELMAKDAYRIKQRISELTEKHTHLMENLKKASGGMDAVFGQYKLSVTVRNGSIEYSSIPELKSINLDLYRKPGSLVYKLEFLGEE